MENGGIPEFLYHPYELAALTLDDHTFPSELRFTCSWTLWKLLSLEFNKMKYSAKTWAEQWAGSRIVEEQSVLVFETSVTNFMDRCGKQVFSQA